MLEWVMKSGHDFSKGKRGAVLPAPRSKERITIRLDSDVLGYFRDQVERAGGGNYQTLINSTLRAHVEGEHSRPTFEPPLSCNHQSRLPSSPLM
jgi:uncharacterized protein (DUF4415 family)